MKRHEALVLLSRDHHDGLLLAVRLQQGKQALERLWSHDPVWQAQHVVQFYTQHLVNHFEEEEMYLFPVALDSIPQASGIVARLQTEHSAMRNSMDGFRTPDLNALPHKLSVFGKLLEGHIRCEEREFFPLLEQYVDTTLLNKLGTAIANHRQTHTQ